jgi:DNA-binding NtrC family response regulator
MPGIDGFQTLEEIKKINPLTSIIMMTDQDIESPTDQTISRGAFAHIEKPVDLVKLLQLTISAVGK